MYDRGTVPGSTLSLTDAEAINGFHGRLPGTVSLIGYGNLYLDQQRVGNPLPVPVLASTLTAPPILPFATTSDRLANIRDFGANAIGITESGSYQKLREILGPERYIPTQLANVVRNLNLTSVERVGMQRQITDLCETLNRSDPTRFVDLSKERTISRNFVNLPQGLGFEKFLYQVLLGYELLLRLRNQPVTTSYRNRIGQKISANLLISEQWLHNVQLQSNYSTTDVQGSPITSGIEVSYVFRPQIHDQQVEGLIRFAELLSWPYMHETRAFMENIFSDLQARNPIGLDILDWIFGLVLPGKEFRLRIMSCLAFATESTKSFQSPLFYVPGLVLPSQTYWPSGSV